MGGRDRGVKTSCCQRVGLHLIYFIPLLASIHHPFLKTLQNTHILYTAIEYINELLDERSALLARLHRARTTLPPGHPALIVPPRKRSGQDMNNIPPGQDEEDDEGPFWEREWQGGLGKLGDMGDGAMDEGDESS